MTTSNEMRRLRGRKITKVHLRPFSDDRGGLAYNPVFYLDDGARVCFVVQETDVGEYGIEPFVIRNKTEQNT